MLAASLVSLSVMAQEKKETTKKKPTANKEASVAPVFVIESQLDSASYAFGYNISQDLKARGFDKVNYKLLAKAMEDGFTDATPMMSKEACQKAIGDALAAASKAKFAPVLAEGQKYLAENKKKSGVITTASGLQYEVLRTAVGDKPKATDQVTVHYKGTLINGKEFDSSYSRNEPTSFPLNGVIRGWTEGVQLMSVGSKYRFVIPYDLAYGENGAGEGIPPYSVLIFEVELVKIGK